MRPRFLSYAGHQTDRLLEIDASNGEFGVDDSKSKSHRMSRRHQCSCILVLASAWTVLSTFYIMVHVYVENMEQLSEGERRLSHIIAPVVTTSAPVFVESNEAEQPIPDQYNSGMEVNRFHGNIDLYENDDDSSDEQVHHDYREVAVDDFCFAFDEHYRENNTKLTFDFDLSDSDESFTSLIKRLHFRMKKGQHILLPLEKKVDRPSWLLFSHEISQYALYDPDSPTVSQLLKDIATNSVKLIVNFDKGTQTKLLLTLTDGAVVLFKPMRFPREQETLPDHFYFNDYERHIAEIAAFHLDRVLGFHRVPPTVGRVFNIEDDLNAFINTSIEENVYISPAGNTCFYTDCEMYCDSNHPICGNPDEIEASLQILLPGKDLAEHEDEIHPWMRSYSKTMLSPWQHDDEYCEKVREEDPYREGRRMLDLMDVAVFDFFMGNMDRHDIDLFLRFRPDTSPILFDNGRGFGKSKEDFDSILTPIVQCCQIRLSTLAKLIKLYRGPDKLSDLMRSSLEEDPLNSVLTEPHLDALDRRLVAILNVVRECVDRKGGFDKVVIDDGH